MSGNTTVELSEEDMIKEELAILKETQKEKKTKVPEPEEPHPVEETKDREQDAIQVEETNTYLSYLGDLLANNQKGQTERAKKMVESNEYSIKKTNGEVEELNYNLLNRQQDSEVRAIQRKYNKIRILTDKIRNTYRSKEDPKFEEFKVAEYMENSVLKGRITGESTRDEVQEAIDEVYEELFGQRLDVFLKDFFGITEDQIENYMYKELTFVTEVAFSEYSTTPY